MANEITVTASLAYANNASGKTIAQMQLQLLNTSFNITGKNITQGSISIPTTAGGTAIPLGGVTTPLGWVCIKNLDTTNYLQILTAASGTTFGRINAGECVVFRLDQGITAPALLANTAAVLVEYLLLEN